ncbi:hypothetical protein [Haloplasma contractile]|uniref:Asparagine synthase n=1 Tax=Haloplasma contractile SSD-17B TaxID=1033810 RepID=U2FH03_9MOLU|nr:hypothetical protein [Haloplasma contractile]ERJ12135.1 hypothetical protein HLPCO_001662 [Haloplasma contractile SSD-17B]
MREGLIPTILGTGVTATGVALNRRNGNNKMMGFRKNKSNMSMLTAGVIGFGLAHIVLGSIDLFEHKE